MIKRVLYCRDEYNGDMIERWTNVRPSTESMRKYIFGEKILAVARKGPNDISSFCTPALSMYGWRMNKRLREVFNQLGVTEEVPLIKQAIIVNIIVAQGRPAGTPVNKLLTNLLERCYITQTVYGNGVIIFEIPYTEEGSCLE